MDQPGIYQATGFQLYTPSDQVLPREYVCFYLTEDCVVNLTDKNGHDEDNVPFFAGYQPILIKKIRFISAGSVYLLTYNRLS